MIFLGPLLLGLAVAEGSGTVSVSASDRSLAVAAQSAPLRAVLEEIGRQSGTRVTYDGAAPTTPLTCNFVAANPREAFLHALEGLGLNYALYGGTPDAPGVLLVFVPSGAAPRRNPVTSVSAPGPAQAVELAEDGEPESASNVADEAVATPPPGGAVPPRFGGPGQALPISEVADDGDRSSGAPGMNRPQDREGSSPHNRPPGTREGRRRGAGTQPD